MKKIVIAVFILLLTLSSSFATENTLNLNGSSQYLNCGNDSSLQITGSMSAFIWVQATNDPTSNETVFSKYDTNGNQRAWQIEVRGGAGNAIRVTLSEDGSTQNVVDATTTLTDGVWYRIGFTYDGTDIKIYVNGTEENSLAYSNGILNSTANVIIGALNEGAANKFDGSLANAFIWNRAITAAEATEDYNNGSIKQVWEYSETFKDGMVLGLPLNTGVATGREFEDYSGKESNAALTGSPVTNGATIDSDDTNLVYNSFGFDGTDDEISVVSNNFKFTDNFSVSSWVKINATSEAYPRIIDYSTFPTGANHGWFLGFENLTTKIYFSVVNLFGASETGYTLNINQWYHVVGVYNSTEQEAYLYVDGVKVKSYTGITGSASYTGITTLTIGNRVHGNDPTEWFNGGVAQPMVFDRVLTSSEIIALYNKNAPLPYSQVQSTVTNDCVLAYELTSNDSSLTDLSGNGNNGTASGGVTSNGSEIDWGNSSGGQATSNTIAGTGAGGNNTGINNTFLGSNSGLNNISGEGNIFIGNNSGANETGSNKLYISNSDTATPLIYGEFDNQKLQINGELRVTGGILANKVHVKLAANWPDYVFAKDYKLLTLDEVEEHINEHSHLPGVPSAKEIENGTLSLDEVMVKQMEKIEELTLYILKLKKENSQSSEVIDVLQKQNEVILERLNALEKAQK